ncbi:MAG: hypothetical protein HY060_24790 [Proteobacteria bacterium]|nr:hypothetical protein [Pseudomonadota bacterium]
MRALLTALIYFGSFLAVGLIVRWAVRRSRPPELTEVHGLAGSNRGKRRVFLLGFWRTEE